MSGYIYCEKTYVVLRDALPWRNLIVPTIPPEPSSMTCHKPFLDKYHAIMHIKTHPLKALALFLTGNRQCKIVPFGLMMDIFDNVAMFIQTRLDDLELPTLKRAAWLKAKILDRYHGVVKSGQKLSVNCDVVFFLAFSFVYGFHVVLHYVDITSRYRKLELNPTCKRILNLYYYNDTYVSRLLPRDKYNTGYFSEFE